VDGVEVGAGVGAGVGEGVTEAFSFSFSSSSLGDDERCVRLASNTALSSSDVFVITFCFCSLLMRVTELLQAMPSKITCNGKQWKRIKNEFRKIDKTKKSTVEECTHLLPPPLEGTPPV
jgi:hypothetical protein